jgi:leucyl/phenylalanyl-tRNA---protein transferase
MPAPVWLSDTDYRFPPPERADAEGLLAVGGDLAPARLLEAYRNGIFPWFDDTTVPLWWCPDPRFVLFPEELRVSASMRQVLRRGTFTITQNTAFAQVIRACARTKRPGQRGTWITRDMEAAYTELHRQGVAHSTEAWQNGELVGGLYGIKLGAFFFGESMFSHRSNASKAAFITFVQDFEATGGRLVDCQVATAHLQSLGARALPREAFLACIAELR